MNLSKLTKTHYNICNCWKKVHSYNQLQIMQHFQTEKYGTEDRDFEIYTYKNNNADQIIIEVKEVTDGKNDDLPCRQVLSMNGEFNLPIEEYEGYGNRLAEIKVA